MESILFIINPIAGTRVNDVSQSLIESMFTKDNGYQTKISFTQYAGHGLKIVEEAVASKAYTTIVIAGGDGTINEIARPLMHTDIKLGIIPSGSGNGLAHHLGIPTRIKKALALTKTGDTLTIDVGTAENNEFGKQLFLSNFGIGYDAEVIHAYSKVKQRGFLTYIFFMFKSMFTLKPKPIAISFDQFKESLKPFVYTVANSSQYGYKIEVAPDASINDGLLDSLLVRDASFFRVMKFAFYSLFKIKDKVTDVAEFYKTQHIEIDLPEKTKVQIDGEPFYALGKTVISIDKDALRIIVPNQKPTLV